MLNFVERWIQKQEAQYEITNNYLSKMENTARRIENEAILKSCERIATSQQKSIASTMHLKEMIKQFKLQEAEKSIRGEIEK